MENVETTPCKSLGIRVSRLIYRGFIHEARELARGNGPWDETERRAILGSGRSLIRFGVPNGLSVAREVLGLR